MNIAKNMEAIFVVAIALITATTGLATASTNDSPQNSAQNSARSATHAVVQAADDSGMTVVNVTAKRLSAAEKAAL